MRLSFKSSLLKKEDSYHQHPKRYFNKIIEKQTEFADTFDDIMEKLSKGELIKYNLDDNNKDRDLIAFITIRDHDGINYICPIDSDTNVIEHDLLMLDYFDSTDKDYYHCTERVGKIKIDLEKYITACSLGYNAAGQIVLGEQCIDLDNKYILTGIFYIYEIVNSTHD